MANGGKNVNGVIAPGLRLQDFLPYLLNQIASRMNSNLRLQIRQIGLSVPQWRVLAVIHAGLGNTIGDLSKHTIIGQSTLSRVVDQMERDGLVQRRVKSDDQRVVEVHMTDRGEKVYAQVLPIALAHFQHAVRSLSPKRQAALVELLHEVLGNVESRFRL